MRILFAAPEKSVEELLNVGATGVITSYAYWRMQKKVDKRLRKFQFVLVDAGSAAFFSAYKTETSLRKSDLPPIDKYIDEYIVWLKANEDVYDYFTELDIGALLRFQRIEGTGRNARKTYPSGRKWVLETRQKFIDAGLQDKMMPIYHPEYHTWEDFVEMTEQYKYVGVGKLTRFAEYNKIFNEVRDKGTKIHAFNMAKPESLRKQPFYSMDCNAWLMGTRYGETYVYRAGRLTQTGDKGVRKMMQTRCKENHINFSALMRDDPKAVNAMNALAWREFGDWLGRNAKRYWKEGLVEGDPTALLDDEGKIILPRNPADTLPAATKGKIAEISAGKSVAKRALTSHQVAMFKMREKEESGETSARKKLSPEMDQYLTELEFVDFSDPEQAKEAVDHLLRQNMKRIAIGQLIELEEGGMQDKNLSTLIKDTAQMIKDYAGLDKKPQSLPPGSTSNTVTQFNIGNTEKLTEDERNSARATIKEALTRIKSENQ
jgi:hypothetical protein